MPGAHFLSKPLRGQSIAHAPCILCKQIVPTPESLGRRRLRLALYVLRPLLAQVLPQWGYSCARVGWRGLDSVLLVV